MRKFPEGAIEPAIGLFDAGAAVDIGGRSVGRRDFREGDSFAIEVLSEAGMILGVALANVAKLLDITVFVVGGGVAEAGDLILAPTEKALKENAMPNQRADAKIVKAALGNRAGILGAALLVAGSVK